MDDIQFAGAELLQGIAEDERFAESESACKCSPTPRRLLAPHLQTAKHALMVMYLAAPAECHSILKLLGVTATPEQLRVRAERPT